MESWPVGEPFALRPHTQRITLAVIMRAVFGVHDEERLARFEGLIDEFARRVGLVASIPPLRRNLGRLSPWGRFLRSRRALDAFIYEEIALRRAEAGHEERDDVLSLLLGARDEDGEPMNDRELRDEMVTVLGAGHETTATGLAWAVERLAHNPARAGEAARLARRRRGGLSRRPRCKETLRARPVIVDVGRKLTAPATIGGYELPRGTFVLAAIAALHYREDTFPEPEAFRPERFLEAKTDNYAWIPFGGGIRRCIGAAFAEYEMRTILREFVERADLRPADPKPEKVKIRNITWCPAKGARVVLERPPDLRRQVRFGLGCRLELASHSASSCSTSRLASAWRSSALGRRSGLAQAAGSASSSSTSRSSLRPSRSAAPAGPPSRRLLGRLWWRCTRLPPPFAAFAGFAARRRRADSRSSRRRWYSAQPRRVAGQLAVLADERAAADRLQQGAVVGDQDHRALELDQRVLERLAALDVEMVGGLVEDQDVGAGGDEDRQREPPLLAAGDVGELLLGVAAGEEEAAEQGARLRPGEAGLALGRVEHVPRPGRGVGVLGEVAEVDVVAGADDARGGLAAPGQGLDQGRLAAAVGADEDDVFAALDLELGVLEQRPSRHLDLRRRPSSARPGRAAPAV